MTSLILFLNILSIVGLFLLDANDQLVSGEEITVSAKLCYYSEDVEDIHQTDLLKEVENQSILFIENPAALKFTGSTQIRFSINGITIFILYIFILIYIL